VKILYVSFWYAPEMGAPAARATELTREWARLGHEVTVLTGFPHYPHGRKRDCDRGVLTRRERVFGVDVVRSYVFAARNAGRIRRTAGYLSFFSSAMTLGALRVGRPDVVIATTPQIFVGVLGATLRTLFGVPLVLEVRDLWPESIVAAGAWTDGPALRTVAGLSRWLYHTADHVVTVGPGYKRGILRASSLGPEDVTVLTNGVDLDRFDPRRTDRAEARRRLGFADHETVVLYLGNHGMCQALHTVVEAADRLRAHRDLRFVFVGDGAERPHLQEAARSRGLDDVRFDPPVPRDDVNAYYAAADICLATLRDTPLFREVIPSKIYEIMAMGRPVVLSVDGDAREIVVDGGAGLFAEPEDAASLCEAILALKADAALRERLGESGRRLVASRFDRRAVARDYLDLLARVVGPRAASAIPGTLTSRPAP
jgi:glycosyltransferase involved in cell wall biosynthesis